MNASDEPSATLVFDYPGADIALRSCDGRAFRVPKLYIMNSSPELGKLIQNSLTPSDGEHADGSLPTIKLPDTASILHSLLTFIFPVSIILPSTTEEIMELLSVAQKYHMTSTMAQVRRGIARQDPSFTNPGNAFHVYSLAHKYGLQQEMLQAARTILNFSMTIEELEDTLDIMPGAALYELWKYHKRARTILATDLTEFSQSSARGTLLGLRCTEFSSSLIPRWLDDYIESIGETPNRFDLVEFNTALARHIRDRANDQRCTCASITSHTIRTFWIALAAAVHDSMEKVNITA
jgi:hypothetical protein